MPKFRVKVYQTYSVTAQGWVEVEAENEDAAADIAHELAQDDASYFNIDLADGCWEDDLEAGEVEEMPE